jgi:hypothetical protein
MPDFELMTVNSSQCCDFYSVCAKKWKTRIELTPDQAWGDAALCSRDFRVSWGELHPETQAPIQFSILAHNGKKKSVHTPYNLYATL